MLSVLMKNCVIDGRERHQYKHSSILVRKVMEESYGEGSEIVHESRKLRQSFEAQYRILHWENQVLRF